MHRQSGYDGSETSVPPRPTMDPAALFYPAPFDTDSIIPDLAIWIVADLCLRQIEKEDEYVLV